MISCMLHRLLGLFERERAALCNLNAKRISGDSSRVANVVVFGRGDKLLSFLMLKRDRF